MNPRINQILTKYSDTNIRTFMETAALGSNQLSLEYSKDPIKKKLLVNNLIQRIIEFRDSLIDPCKIENRIIIEKHKQYFFSPYEFQNSEIRGPQIHISQQMFSDFGFAVNLIELSNITACSLSSMTTVYTAHTPEVIVPKSFLKSSPHTFRQAIEATGAKMHSGVTGHNIYLTDDDPKNMPNHTKYVNNMPQNQKVGDFIRVIPDKKGIIAIEEDAKNRTIEKAISTNDAGVYFVGSVDPKVEYKSLKIIAQTALASSMPIHKNVIAMKNNPKDTKLALSYIACTGKVEAANELAMFPIIMSNRHNDPSNLE